MAQDMVIYWGSGSAPCVSSLITLEEKALQGYQSKLLSFEKKEHKTEEILKLNPRGEMPILRHGDIVVNESAAICDYLEAVFKDQGTRLIPGEPAKMAEVLQRRSEVPNLQKKGTQELVYPNYGKKPEEIDQELFKKKSEAFSEELSRWEGYLEKQAGSGGYLCGKFSLADVIMFPVLMFHVRMGLQLADKRPFLKSYYDKMCERPSVKVAWPPHWKDSEGKDLLKDV